MVKKNSVTRRDFVKKFAIAAAGLTLSPLELSAKGAENKMTKSPNLVYVFPDEMSPFAMGFRNQYPVLTPNLDKFAAESLVLTNAVSNYPLCSPYRAMLFTGKYTHANGVIDNCTPDNPWELSADTTCLSDALHEAGYSQGYIGKWHLDQAKGDKIDKTLASRWWDCFVPPQRRHQFDFWHSYNCFDDHLNPHYYAGDKINERVDPKKWSPEHEADVAIEYIKNSKGQRDREKPFALFVSMNPPHMPFHAVPEKYKKLYKDKDPKELLTRPNVMCTQEARDNYGRNWAELNVNDYFAAVTGVDEQFGRILDCLKEQGLEEDTIVVFTADHGEMMGSHGLMYKNSWYDESMLVPFLIRWPGKIKPGQDDLLLSVPDLMPTLLTMTGVSQGIPKDLEGSDHSTILLGRGGDRPDSALYLNVDPDKPELGKRGLRTHRYTFVIDRSQGNDHGEITATYRLYDNRKDPYQLKEISAEQPEVIKQLKKELNKWLKKTKDPWGKV